MTIVRRYMWYVIESRSWIWAHINMSSNLLLVHSSHIAKISSILRPLYMTPWVSWTLMVSAQTYAEIHVMNITCMLRGLRRLRLKYIYSWSSMTWILSNLWLSDDMTNWLHFLVNFLLTGEGWDWGIIETRNCWASRQGWADEDCRRASDLREGEEGNGYQVERNPSMSPWILISQKPGNIMFLPDPWTYLYWSLCWRSSIS